MQLVYPLKLVSGRTYIFCLASQPNGETNLLSYFIPSSQHLHSCSITDLAKLENSFGKSYSDLRYFELFWFELLWFENLEGTMQWCALSFCLLSFHNPPEAIARCGWGVSEGFWRKSSVWSIGINQVEKNVGKEFK